MFKTWEDLDYWTSGEWQVIQERLDDLDRDHKLYNPSRELLFAALDATPFDSVKVVFVGQDPYPDRNMACGLAFSIPNGTIPTGNAFPPTLDNMFKEYVNDLHHPLPDRTDLLPWAHRGVLLWNAIPSCRWRASMSHDWSEYVPLTAEILRRLSTKGKIVFVFMGGVARRYAHLVDTEKDGDFPKNFSIEVSHPVPRASIRSAVPFTGSRIYSRVNDHLTDLGVEPINWKL